MQSYAQGKETFALFSLAVLSANKHEFVLHQAKSLFLYSSQKNQKRSGFKVLGPNYIPLASKTCKKKG